MSEAKVGSAERSAACRLAQPHRSHESDSVVFSLMAPQSRSGTPRACRPGRRQGYATRRRGEGLQAALGRRETAEQRSGRRHRRGKQGAWAASYRGRARLPSAWVAFLVQSDYKPLVLLVKTTKSTGPRRCVRRGPLRFGSPLTQPREIERGA